MRQAIALWGHMSISPCNLPEIVKSFDWDFVHVQSSEELSLLYREREIACVISVPRSLGMDWSEVMDELRRTCPMALPIIATYFSEHTPWPEMAEAGVFHAFALPMREDEVRQSLAFAGTAIRTRSKGPQIQVAKAGKGLRAVA